MASLGAFLLLLAFVTSAYAAAASVAGARLRNARLTASGVGALYLVAAVMTVASGVIVHAFVVGDFTIKYVQRYSETAQPLVYKIASYWGGLDGSVMFWVFLLSLFGAAAVRINRDRHRELIPYVVATLSVVQMFFLFLMIVHNNPFATYLTQAPGAGQGLNPLLQNFYMAIHPPTMYLGFVGMTIPFAFCIAALITGHLDDSWLRAVRRWTMISWFCLSLGLTLGMIWAYEELGWGGFWGWDPVENAGLLPWFTATAFLHSVMVQERRGMLRVWNVTLVIVTFFLTLFGTFMTRSGIVQSVHAFGEDRALAWMFTVFMSVTLVFSFGWVIYRLPLLKARNELDSWVSKEAAFLANNWVLLFSAVVRPLRHDVPDAVGGAGRRAAHRRAAVLQHLDDAGGPHPAARSPASARCWPGAVRRWPTCAISSSGRSSPGWSPGRWRWASASAFWPSGLCFAHLRVRHRDDGPGVPARRGRAARDDRHRPVHGDGRAGGAQQAALRRLHRARRHRPDVPRLRRRGLRARRAGAAQAGPERHRRSLHAAARRHPRHRRQPEADGHRPTSPCSTPAARELGKMYPAKWYFRTRPNEPTTEVAIWRSLAEDLYIVMAGFELGEQAASVEIHINELVNWIWLGFGLLALGTGIALLPDRVFAFATARVGVEATATLLLAALLLASPVSVLAQTTGTLVERSQLERDLANEVMCTCGCRLPAGTCGMTNCEGKASQLARVHNLVSEGKSRDEVLDAFVSEFGGQHILARPIDEGYHRLLWILPYSVAAFAALGLGLMARRWSREGGRSEPVALAAGADSGLQQQLDDELRDLD